MALRLLRCDLEFEEISMSNCIERLLDSGYEAQYFRVNRDRQPRELFVVKLQH